MSPVQARGCRSTTAWERAIRALLTVDLHSALGHPIRVNPEPIAVDSAIRQLQ